jgi:1-acyl-sn-glycerol-3-phosphate acyltransferase
MKQQQIDVNCKCPCGSYLCMVNDELVGLNPCQHLLHTMCVNKIKNQNCPICGQHINYIATFDDVRAQINANNLTHYQQYIDMLCVRNTSDFLGTSYTRLLTRTPFLTECIARLSFASNLKDIENILNFFIDTCKIRIKVIGKEKILNDKKVIIANHNGYMDPLIIYKVFNCGFLSSEIVNDFWYIQRAISILPILIVKRGTDKNTVKKMHDYIRDNKDLCIFPEGLITHPNILCRFRTGSFHTGFPVQPIIVKYNPHVYDNSATKFLLKAMSQEGITATEQILDPVYPPFTQEKIEIVRHMMAEAGNFAISRVSNRSVKD